MKLTQRLLGHLNRVFDKGPEQALVLRIRYDGGMRWTIADGILTTQVTGGSGAAFSVDLRNYTVAGLASFVASRAGYSVPFVDATPVPGLSATVLIDGSGDQDTSNGDHLYAYTSVLWAYLESQSSDISLAALTIVEALKQMAASTASGEWVDEHGSYYEVPRMAGEGDSPYAARIVAEVGRARGTNVAIAEAVRRASGADSVDVDDYAVPTVSGGGISSYGLFDVTSIIDINAPLLPDQIDANTRSVIEAMRDAGTHLRTLRYIRRATIRPMVSSYMKAGMYVTVSFGSLALDGTWYLDGSEELDGLRNNPL